MNKNNFITIWLGLLTIDVILTAIGIIGKNAEEINPIARWIIGLFGFFGLWIYGVIILIIFTLFIESTYKILIKRFKFKNKHKEQAYQLLIYLTIFVYGYVLINNFRVAFL